MADKRLQVILDLKDRMSSKLRKPESGLKRLSSSIGTLQGALSVGLVVSAGKAAFELGELGARSIDVRRNLEAFAGGAEQAEKYLNAVVSASNNTVDRMTAGSVASRMLQMGIADTNEEMALYVEGAVRLGDQTMSSGQRIGDMIQLLKNLNVNMLDNFGLSKQVVMGRTRELQASQGLSREEAMLIAIQEDLERQLGVLGDQSEDGALAIDQMKAAAEDAKIALGEALAPAVTAVAEEAAEAIPKLVTTTEQLSILAEAGIAWAEAALSGEDATNSFNDEILRGTEGVTTLGKVVRDAVAAGTAYTDSMAASDAAISRNVQESAKLASSLIMVHSKQKEAAAAITETLGPLGAQAIAMYRNVQASKTMNKAMLSTISTVRSMTSEAVMSMVPDEAIQMLGVLRDEQQRAKDEFLRNAALHGRAEEDAAAKTKAAWDSAYAEAQAAAAKFDSEVQSLFQSTMNVDVSAKLQGAGFRTDTWDEWKRRAADVMNLGKDSPWFEKLVANFPSFNDLLAKMGDPGAAAAAWIQQFDAGMIPEAVNLDAIVEAYKSKVASEEAWAGIYEQAKAAILAQGGDVDESLLRQLTGGPMATDELDDIAGGFQDIGSDVSGTKAEVTKLGKKAGVVFPQIGSEIQEVRKNQRRWNDALADTISLLKQINEMEVNWPTPPTGGGGGEGGAGAGEGGGATGGGGGGAGGGQAVSAGFRSIYVGNITVSPDDTFRKALKSVGVPNL